MTRRSTRPSLGRERACHVPTICAVESGKAKRRVLPAPIYWGPCGLNQPPLIILTRLIAQCASIISRLGSLDVDCSMEQRLHRRPAMVLSANSRSHCRGHAVTVPSTSAVDALIEAHDQQAIAAARRP